MDRFCRFMDGFADQELPVAYSIPVLYEDSEILIVDKPWDVRVDGDFSVTVETLVREGLGRVMDRFRLCNQLDYSTSGVLVLGKTSKGAGNCNKLFQTRLTRKWYLAVGSGSADLIGWQSVTASISEVPNDIRMQIDPNGKLCESLILPIRKIQIGGNTCTLFLVRLVTGRRHQIRLHLKQLGFPIVGDATYGENDRTQCPRMMLHAWKLVLPFPKQTVTADAVPHEFFSHTDVTWEQVANDIQIGTSNPT